MVRRSVLFFLVYLGETPGWHFLCSILLSLSYALTGKLSHPGIRKRSKSSKSSFVLQKPSSETERLLVKSLSLSLSPPPHTHTHSLTHLLPFLCIHSFDICISLLGNPHALSLKSSCWKPWESWEELFSLRVLSTVHVLYFSWNSVFGIVT